MDLPLAEKYRPQFLDQLKRDKAIEEIRKWARAWKEGKPIKPGLLIYGPPGTGKTSAAMALAREMSWEYYELNASDVRSKKLLEQTAILTSQYFQLSDHPSRLKLIVLDEVDSLYERNEQGYDTGGKSAILQLLNSTQNPVVLIANDPYQLKSSTTGRQIADKCLEVNFQRYRSTQIYSTLKEICFKENMNCPDDVLKDIAERANGDMRAAINDLEGFNANFRGETRDQTENIYSLINDAIFGRRDFQEIKNGMINLGEDPNNLILFFIENIFKLNDDKMKFHEALERLAKADDFLGRVLSRNNYAMWGYANDLISSISTMKLPPSKNYRFSYPNLIRKMAELRTSRNIRRNISAMGGRYVHKSSNFVSLNILPIIASISAKDEKFKNKMKERFGDIFEELESIEP